MARDADGRVLIGKQYQSHNHRDGPVYAGGGYTPMSRAIHEGAAAVARLLDAFPDAVDDVSTGGARPLHMCGMSRRGQLSARLLIERGADIEAVDTYGYRPLHRYARAVGLAAWLAAWLAPG